MGLFETNTSNTTTRRAWPRLPDFAREMGVRRDDVELFGRNASADAHTLRFTERGADGQPTGVLTVTGSGKCWFTRAGTRGLTWSTEHPGMSRILLTTGSLAALCAASQEDHRRDTLYVALPGCWSGLSVPTFEALLARTQPRWVMLGMPDTARGDALANKAQQIVGARLRGATAAIRLPWPEHLARRRGLRK